MENEKKCGLICELCRHKSKDCGRQVFPCSYMKTRGEQLVEEFGGKGADEFLKKDEKLSKKYSIFSRIVLDEHGDPTKPPEWLDVDKNTCLHFIRDEFDIVRKFNAINKKHFDQSDIWWD